MKLNGNSRGGEHTGAPEDGIRVTEVRSDDASPKAFGAETTKKARRRAFLIGGCVLLAVLAVVVGYAIWEKPPEIAPSDPETTDAPGASDAALPGSDPDGAQGGEEELDDGEAPAVPMTSDRKEGVYTFLRAGVDKASDSTDTIMVVSFDTENHTISCTSIPRDTLINISWATTPKKINAVYPGFINSGKDGMEGLRAHVKNLLGFEVDRSVTVYLQAVEDAVDAIGGVWFDVPQDMVYEDYVQDLDINIKAGYQKLSGSDALKLCRFRHGYSGGDLQRIGVQQDFLKALAGQILSLGSVPHLRELIDVLMEDVDTDLTAANLAWFARQFLSCKSEDITFQTVPISGAGNSINGVSLVGVNVSAWLKMVNDSINPYVDDVTAGNVNILTYGYGGASVGATTGSIAGGWDSFYCQSCTAATGHAEHHAPGEHLSFETEAPEESDADGGESPEPEEPPEPMEPAEPVQPAEPESPETPEGPEIVTPEPGAEPDITG